MTGTSSSPSRVDRGKAIVVGAGVVGLAVALELLDRGWRTSVFDRAEPGAGASSAAAGMLCPFAERIEVEPLDAARSLGVEALALWPAWAERMRANGGLDPAFAQTGSWCLARDAAAAAALAKLAAEAPAEAQAKLLSAEAARDAEHHLGRVEVVLSLPTEAAVDPARACAALARLVRRAGGEIASNAQVVDVEAAWTPSVVVEHDGRRRRESANVVVIAAGWRAAAFSDWAAMRALRPVKGEAAALAPGGGPQPDRILRERDVYLVPRPDGHLILGASVLPGRCDRGVDPASIERLTAAAEQVLPGVAARAIARTWAGVRPGSADGAPLLGPLDEGVWAACGFHRNGVLLAPAAAVRLVDAIEAGEDTQAAATRFAGLSPARFEAAAPNPVEPLTSN